MGHVTLCQGGVSSLAVAGENGQSQREPRVFQPSLCRCSLDSVESSTVPPVQLRTDNTC